MRGVNSRAGPWFRKIHDSSCNGDEADSRVPRGTDGRRRNLMSTAGARAGVALLLQRDKEIARRTVRFAPNY
jgi:hypothetical protein